MFIRCGRGAFGWSFVVGFASGVWGWGGVVFCVFPLCCNFCVFVGFQSRVRVDSVKYFKFISTVYWTLCLFWCVSFTGFLDVLTVFEVFIGVHCLALITSPLPVPFCWCPSPCPGGCSCTTENVSNHSVFFVRYKLNAFFIYVVGKLSSVLEV